MTQLEELNNFISSSVFITLKPETRADIIECKARLLSSEVLKMFTSLNRNKTGNCYAPHKAIMLLAIMELVEKGHITSTKITLDKELKDTFKRVWGCTVPVGSSFTCEYRNPFTYMDKSFWTPTADRNVAIISADVLSAMKDADTRNILVSCLTDMVINDTVDDIHNIYNIESSDNIFKAAEDLMIAIPFIGSCLSLLA